MRLLSSILCAALYPNIVNVLTPSKTFIQSAVGAVAKENAAKDIKFSTQKEMVRMLGIIVYKQTHTSLVYFFLRFLCIQVRSITQSNISPVHTWCTKKKSGLVKYSLEIALWYPSSL